MSFANPIRREDPQAIEKLNEQIKAAEELQTKMKAVNAYYRKAGTCKGFPGMSAGEAAKHDANAESGYSWEKQPYPSYALSGNSAEIRRLKKRVEEIKKDRETGFTGWTFQGGEVVANEDACRLQIFFDEKPNEEQRTALKSNGFHWAPTENAWQRQLNQNAVYAADRLEFIRPDNGKRVYELQPKQASEERSEETR